MTETERRRLERMQTECNKRTEQVAEFAAECERGYEPAASGGRVRAYADNVIIRLEPLETTTASGLAVVRSRATESKGTRTAVVLASGPGHTTRQGKFIPNETRPGQRVLVDAMAGQDYSLDLEAPRSNASAQYPDASSFSSLLGQKGEYRIVREDEILGVLE